MSKRKQNSNYCVVSVGRIMIVCFLLTFFLEFLSFLKLFIFDFDLILRSLDSGAEGML